MLFSLEHLEESETSGEICRENLEKIPSWISFNLLTKSVTKEEAHMGTDHEC